MNKDNFIIQKNECICLNRTLCNRVDFCNMINQIKNLVEDNTKDKSTMVFLSYVGIEYSLEKMLEKNLHTKNVPINSRFIYTINRDEFIKSKKRRYVFEIVVDEMSDISSMHYFLLLLKYLEYKNENYNVLISSTRTDSNRYSAIESGDYFRISHLLYFYAKNSSIDKTFSRIKVYCNIPAKSDNSLIKKASNIRWCRLASNYENQPQVGRIVPIIPITSESFEALITDYRLSFNEKNAKNDWCLKVYGLCDDYIQRIISLDDSILSEDLLELLNSDNCLEALIFLSTLYYIILQDKEYFSRTSNLMSISNIHEACADYSQGIIQLAENIINHVIDGTNGTGSGILSVRFRTKSDAKKIYIKNENEFSDVNYFMEIYITDFQFEKFEGILDKFHSTVKKRILTNIDNYDELLINSKFYFSQKTDIEMFEMLRNSVNSDLIREITTYVEELKKKKLSHTVKLSDLFLNETNKPLRDYLSSSENIAFHYGLQILNSVISVADGYLYVKSGIGISNTFSNYNNEEQYVDMSSLEYDYGTLYLIYIPIRLKQNINFLDSVAATHSTVENKCDYVSFKDSIKIIDPKKEIACKKLCATINNNFNVKNNLEPMLKIGIIDCEKVFNASELSRTYIYEILAKALFLYMVQEDSKIDNVALINVEDKYDVIKIFRQFALFFDRYGKNLLMKKEKNVFIIDTNADADILLCGNTLKSISKSLCLSQLYGGSDEKAMEIIKCLVRTGYE